MKLFFSRLFQVAYVKKTTENIQRMSFERSDIRALCLLGREMEDGRYLFLIFFYKQMSMIDF